MAKSEVGKSFASASFRALINIFRNSMVGWFSSFDSARPIMNSGLFANCYGLSRGPIYYASDVEFIIDQYVAKAKVHVVEWKGPAMVFIDN
jgi:hypothetical protein